MTKYYVLFLLVEVITILVALILERLGFKIKRENVGTGVLLSCGACTLFATIGQVFMILHELITLHFKGFMLRLGGLIGLSFLFLIGYCMVMGYASQSWSKWGDEENGRTEKENKEDQ